MSDDPIALSAADLELHARLRIPSDLLHRGGVYRVTDADARTDLGISRPGDLAGVVYPYRDPETHARVTCRLRRDHPEIEAGRPVAKYLSPYGDRRHLYFAPGADARLADTSTLVVIVEAEKSALAITAAAERADRPVLAIATGGCWCWKGRIGKTVDASGADVDEKGPLPDFSRVTWTARDVVILFDANAAVNHKVQQARRELAADLARRGARVRIGVLPTGDPRVNGPDDLIGVQGDAALWTVIGAARASRHREDKSAPARDRTPSNKGAHDAPEDKSSPAACSLADVERVFKKWIRDADPLPTRAVLAAYVANHLDGDPVWLMLVAGSGMGKTERMSPLAGLPDVVLESSISGEAALLSASSKKDRAKDASGGVLCKLPNGRGVLVLKDFTSIIDMHRDRRAEVLAALREIYDGRWGRSVGADGGRTLTWTGKLGLIAGCTTVWDTAHGVVGDMGPRFVGIRLNSDNTLAQSALDHVGQEPAMRRALRDAVCGLLAHPTGTPHPIDDAIRPPIEALGTYVAFARSPIDRDHQGEIRLVLDPEAPTRIVKVLAQIWRAAGVLGLSRAEAWHLVARIGMDSIPKLRRRVLDYLGRKDGPQTTTVIAEAVEHPSRTTRRALEDLHAHRLVHRHAGGEGKADLWALTKYAQCLRASTVPDPSASTHTPRSKEPIHVQDDITGKVRGDDEPY
jgi:hypothetical protein